MRQIAQMRRSTLVDACDHHRQNKDSGQAAGTSGPKGVLVVMMCFNCFWIFACIVLALFDLTLDPLLPGELRTELWCMAVTLIIGVVSFFAAYLVAAGSPRGYSFWGSYLFYFLLGSTSMLVYAMPTSLSQVVPPDAVYQMSNISSNLPAWGDVTPHGRRAQPYPVCRRWWGSEDAQVTALDLATLSRYAYASSANATEFVQSSFGEVARVINRSDSNYTLPNYLAVRFNQKVATPETPDTVVIAVRGTSNAMELNQDMSQYATVLLLQSLSNSVFPVLHIFPRSIVHEVIWFFLPSISQNRVDKFNELVGRIQEENPNSTLVMTGHSLGGMFAELASMNMSLDSLVFSAPGIRWVSSGGLRQLNFSSNMYTVVVPDSDPVPRVDEHLGEVQPIACRNREGNVDKSGTVVAGNTRYDMSCHTLTRTICELWRACGDTSHDFSSQCLTSKFGEGPWTEAKQLGEDFSREHIFPYRKDGCALLVGFVLSIVAAVLLGLARSEPASASSQDDQED